MWCEEKLGHVTFATPSVTNLSNNPSLLKLNFKKAENKSNIDILHRVVNLKLAKS